MPTGINISASITDRELLDMHWNKQMSMYEIAIHFGYSKGAAKTAMFHIFSRRRLSKRSSSEALRVRYQIKPDTFFKNKPKGSNHWKWNGGKRSNQGYTLIKKPSHPRADPLGYVREHILIWEEAHNKPVPKGWIIHHLNGIRDDNRPENLLAVTRGKHEHQTFVKTLQARIRKLEQLHLPI